MIITDVVKILSSIKFSIAQKISQIFLNKTYKLKYLNV